MNHSWMIHSWVVDAAFVMGASLAAALIVFYMAWHYRPNHRPRHLDGRMPPPGTEGGASDEYADELHEWNNPAPDHEPVKLPGEWWEDYAHDHKDHP